MFKKFVSGFFHGKVLEKKADSMMSYMLYGALLIVVVIGLIGQYNKSKENNNYNDFVGTVSVITSSIQTLFNGQEYETLTAQELNRAGIYPIKTMRGSIAVNPWGGEYQYTGDGSSFTLTATKLPKDSCIKASQFGADWLSITVNSTEVTTEDLPISPKNAVGYCSSESNNTIIFKAH